MKPFVHWAGGKRQLLPKLKARMPASYGTYYEPFIGCGALFLDIQPAHAVISDINEQLINVYQQLKTNAESVIRAVSDLNAVPCDADRYKAMRDEYNCKILKHELDADCAALMIYVIKYCYNGAYRVNSKGLFSNTFNYGKPGTNIDEINLMFIGRYLQSKDIVIRQGDFEAACCDAKPGDFIYFDPPYVPIGKTANSKDYTKDGFSIADHERLAKLFKKLSDQGVQCMLSNRNSPFVHELYSEFNIQIIDVKRCIHPDPSKRTDKEVIITNY